VVSVCEYECLCEDVSLSLYAKTAKLLVSIDEMSEFLLKWKGNPGSD